MVGKLQFEKRMNSGNGILIIGVIWLIFWLGPAFFLFESDARWGHNFAIPIVFITVGLAYNFKTIACQLTAVFAAFVVTIPTLLALWSWDIALALASAFFFMVILLYLIERTVGEVLKPKPRLKAWLSIHLLSFCYIGLLHMALIFFVSRWSNPDPFSSNLPAENDLPTAIFNAMLIVLVPLAVMERYVKTLAGYSVSRAGFIWSILMIIIPLLIINIFK